MKKDSNGSVRIAAMVRDLVESGAINPKGCGHLLAIHDVVPSADGCKDCLISGDSWVHLRLCLTCGYVGCCDNSKNKHATRHHHETLHSVIVSYEEGEKWLWCYIDQIGIEL